MSFLRQTNILHRTLAAALCLALVTGAAAQRTRKHKGPRALALVEWPAGGGAPRVIPVTIMVDGRFYDASIYMASPVPMALDPGNVYEVEQSGESIGLATLTAARQARNGAWLADARFRSHQQLAAARRPRESDRRASAPEGPPRLRRGKEQAQSEPAATPPAPPRGADEPPVLRKPAGETQQPETKPAAQTGAQPAGSPTAPESSDHPILRRGRPTAEQAENLPGAVESQAAPKAPAAAAGPATPAAKAAAAGAGRVLTAISDAGGPEPRSYALPWNAEEQESLKAGMTALASSALEEWARTHGGTHPGKLQDVQLRAFDVNTSNEPQLVLMAQAREAPAPVARTSPRRGAPASAASAPAGEGGLRYWITLAARQNYDGALRKLKVWATDSRHLDAYPRAELIDAVDADGDGRGELLFREIFDAGQNFALYRVTPDMLTELYNSGALER